MRPQRLAVCGLGPHFLARHLVTLASLPPGSVDLAVGIDLACRRDVIEAALADSPLRPRQMIYLDDRQRHRTTPRTIAACLGARRAVGALDAAIVSTDPSAHAAYIAWALGAGLDVFCDKPLTAPLPGQDPSCLRADFERLVAMARSAGRRVVLSCERRRHPGYLWLRAFLRDVVGRAQMPITYVDLFDGDGCWMMPDEFAWRESHPVKYGHGALFHSAYHFVDLLEVIVDINREMLGAPLAMQPPAVLTAGTYEQAFRVGPEAYRRLMATSAFDAELTQQRQLSHRGRHGEIDLTAMGRYVGPGGPLTDFCLRMLELTVSRRTSPFFPTNTYLGSGRLRQEAVTVHVGPAASVSVRHRPSGHAAAGDSATADFVGEAIVHPALAGGRLPLAVDARSLAASCSGFIVGRSLNIQARAAQLKDFLAGGDGDSPLTSHRQTVAAMSAIHGALVHDRDRARLPLSPLAAHAS